MLTDDLENLSRRERERLLRRREMIMAARRIFAQKGYAETKLEDVAELAEYGKGTLYNYFPNKEALFSSVLEETFYGFSRIFSETLNADMEFSQKLRTTIRGSLEYAFTYPDAIMLMFRESHHIRVNNPLVQLRPQLAEMLADTIAAEQQKDPRILRIDSLQLASVLMTMVMGQFMNRLHNCFLRIREMEGATEAECQNQMKDIFGALNREEMQQEIDRITDLIHTIFFCGLYTKSENG